jgi:Zn-dependent peptidase ImmA (M78 family)
MAHEYIHYQINRDIIKENSHNDIILFRDDIIKLDIDIAANRYAAELLMPEKDFRKAQEKYSGDIIKIAEIFGVSTIAVRYRAKDLGLEGHGL